MKILLLLTAFFVIFNATCGKKITSVSDDSGDGKHTKEARGKRNLNFLESISSNRREDSYNYQSSGYNFDSNYIGNAPNHHNIHRYPEPPEPIIEIIIQDNNETLPEPQPYAQNNGKKKKEQVQVFYVKYHKDEHKGLVIHEPVAALSPAGHEQHEEEDHHDDLTIVTPVPNIPRKTTTLRTIIRPESEQYESSSGVHVTFNRPHNHHSKSDNHVHDEEKVESALQPVIQLPNRSVLPIKEKRQQPQFLQSSPVPSSLTQGRIVNGQNGNFNHQSLPHQRPPVEFNPQNNFISHSNQPFLSNQLTLPSQEPSKPFHPSAHFNHNNNNNIHHHHNHLQSPISIPINHHQNQQGVLGHQQQINQRLPPLHIPPSQTQQAPLLKPPQRVPAPPVNFNQNQRPFNYHAHSTQAQQQSIQRPQQIQSPPRNTLLPQNFHNINQQQVPPFNRPPVHFNTQYPVQQPIHFSQNQGPPVNFKPDHKITPSFPSKPFQNHQPSNNQNVFQGGGLVEQVAPNLAHFQQLPNPQNSPSHAVAAAQPQHDINFNQQKFIQSTFGSDVQVSSSVPKFEHHITETVNPPVFFQPTALDMDKLVLSQQDNVKNIGPLVGKIGNLMVTQKPLVQHRFAPHVTQNNHFLQAPQENSHFQSQKNNFIDVNARNNNFASSTSAPTTVRKTTITTTISTTEKPQASPSTTEKPQAYYQLPDEIPDDLRKQLEESGVLENAQISILDYDKIGDTSLQDLPPEHLANFFSAGGGAQIGANSNKVISLLKPNGESVGNQIQTNKDFSKLLDANGKPTKKEDVNLRVVKFDMQSQRKLPEVSAKSQNYSRYLPIKISGAQFPTSGIDEVRGKEIISIVVLAPVAQEDDSGNENSEKDTFEAGQIKFLSGDILKNLIKKPSTENFKKWFEHEQKATSDLQSVVLLVTLDRITNEKEIFMYDIGSKSVSHLNGELSSNIVQVADDNANASESGIPITQQIDRIDSDVDSSENVETLVDLSGKPVNNQVLISSGYSVIKNE